MDSEQITMALINASCMHAITLTGQHLRNMLESVDNVGDIETCINQYFDILQNIETHIESALA